MGTATIMRHSKAPGEEILIVTMSVSAVATGAAAILALAVSKVPSGQVLQAEVDEVEAAMPSSVTVRSAGCTTHVMAPEAMVAAVAVVVVVAVAEVVVAVEPVMGATSSGISRSREQWSPRWFRYDQLWRWKSLSLRGNFCGLGVV